MQRSPRTRYFVLAQRVSHRSRGGSRYSPLLHDQTAIPTHLTSINTSPSERNTIETVRTYSSPQSETEDETLAILRYFEWDRGRTEFLTIFKLEKYAVRGLTDLTDELAGVIAHM
jgi:hypothetical protein